MKQSNPHHPRRPRAAGFTLIELLVVLAIITILAAILLPVISSLRLSAQGADTRNQIQVLSGAIKAYYDTFHSYPGPLADNDMYTNQVPQGITGQQVTMAENLFLGIVGGLRRDTPGGPVIFVPPQLGSGPGDLSTSGKTYDSIMKDWAGQISGGFFKDFTGRGARDTNIPEFVDRFKDHPMPILYLRARQGAPGIMYNGNVPVRSLQYQYDVRQYQPYYVSQNGASPIPLYGLNYQGLIGLGGFTSPLRSPDPTASGAVAKFGINDILPYFRSTSDPGTSNDRGNPRVKDTFILISPGPDGIYGTSDDITTFGSVIP